MMRSGTDQKTTWAVHFLLWLVVMLSGLIESFQVESSESPKGQDLFALIISFLFDHLSLFSAPGYLYISILEGFSGRLIGS